MGENILETVIFKTHLSTPFVPLLASSIRISLSYKHHCCSPLLKGHLLHITQTNRVAQNRVSQGSPRRPRTALKVSDTTRRVSPRSSRAGSPNIVVAGSRPSAAPQAPPLCLCPWATTDPTELCRPNTRVPGNQGRWPLGLGEGEARQVLESPALGWLRPLLSDVT